jgi:hypothetical protein
VVGYDLGLLLVQIGDEEFLTGGVESQLFFDGLVFAGVEDVFNVLLFV